MLRPRKEPDPISGKRKLLADQEKQLAERMNALNAKLARGGVEEPSLKAPEPPVWRMEEEVSAPRRSSDFPTMNRRVLNRQRQRDRLIFFVMVVALILAVALVLAIAHSHLAGNLPGS